MIEKPYKMIRRGLSGQRGSRLSDSSGFSLVELIISMVITLVILGVAVAAFSGALGSRDFESSRTDAITSAQAALNIMSREIGNSGYGLYTNGIVLADSNGKMLHIRCNTSNNNYTTNDANEDLTFFYDPDSQSVVRYDSNTNATSGIINRISDVDFLYQDYPVTGPPTTTPTANTGKVTITLKVKLIDARGEPTGRYETVKADITLRNAPYMLGQY
jgi:Tfp pilus assembly protein PilW